MEHYSMVAPSARNVSRRFFCSRIHLTNARSDFCWHPLWSVIMVQDPKACIAGHKFKFMKPTLSRRNQHEKKAQRPMPVSVHLASEQLLDFPNYSRTVAIDKSLETQENRHKKVQDGDSSENLNAFSDIPAAVSELKAIQADSMRSKLVCKLSEANQYGRNLQRKVQETNETLSKCKGELAMMEVELQMLVQLAQEIARAGGKSLSKINGRYISSHLASRLEDLHKRVLSQIKDVDAMRLRDVPLQWYGMAEVSPMYFQFLISLALQHHDLISPSSRWPGGLISLKQDQWLSSFRYFSKRVVCSKFWQLQSSVKSKTWRSRKIFICSEVLL